MTKLPKSARIYVAGHRGLVGSAILRALGKEGYTNLLTATREQLDLRDQAAVNSLGLRPAAHNENTLPQAELSCLNLPLQDSDQDKLPLSVASESSNDQREWARDSLAFAGTVGGILANSSRPAEFIYDNMMIHATVVQAAYLYGIKKLLYLGSSCIYPRECPQPMKEEYLLSGWLEPTNEPYAIAKIAGIKLCQAYRKQYGCNFISAMPTNLYGPGDNFDLLSSHVLPALIRKFHLAKLACQGEWEGIQQDEALFGPIPGDLRQSLGLPPAALENNLPLSAPSARSSDPRERARDDFAFEVTVQSASSVPKKEKLPQAEPFGLNLPLRDSDKDNAPLSALCELERSGREKRDLNSELQTPQSGNRAATEDLRYPVSSIQHRESVVIWGTGSPRREFLHVDDLASACLFIMEKYEDLDHINVGTGQDQTIGELAELVRDIVYPEANLVFDHSKPDGTPQKLLDNRKLRDLGWISKIDFTNGIKNTYAWYLSQIPNRALSR